MIGATIPIRPTARPRYSAVIPMPPKIPDRTDHPRSIGPGIGSARSDREHGDERHPDQLRHQHDTEDRGLAADEPAAEITRPPGDGRGEREEDRRELARERSDQAAPSTTPASGATDEGSSTPSSTDAGPGSSMTRSAAAS